MIDQIRFFAGAARNLEGLSAGEYMHGMTSFIRREPIGVCAQVTPWNYPMMMAVWKWAPAIAAGNTVVLKPSDTTPASTIFMAEVMSEFLPEGVFNVVCGDRETGRALISHEIPQLVAITGSVRAGMEVASAASQDVKRVHLELGGKAPVVVFDDADLEAAAAWIAVAGFFNAGQDCTAATRVLVGPKAYDDFVALLTEQAKLLVEISQGEFDLKMDVPIYMSEVEKSEFNKLNRTQRDRSAKLDLHRGQVYSLILGQCSQLLQDKMKQDKHKTRQH
jgi:betaine-aldehyde dehydrogenase